MGALRRHTIYQAGIAETDDHIALFWSVLEASSQKQLQEFLKFASNIERVPIPRGPDNSLSQVPPYPLKIAPPDRIDLEQDRLNIRAETCMFLVKLPRYSSLEVMREKIRFAASTMFDPLSG